MPNRPLASLAAAALALAFAAPIPAAPPRSVRTTEAVALTGGHVIVAPGREVDADVVIRDGVVVSIGGAIPPGARRWDVTGLVVWPALVDPHVGLSRVNGIAEPGPAPNPDADAQGPPAPVPESPLKGSAAASANPLVHPEASVADVLAPDQKALEALRSQGFAVACVVPDRGILRGTDAVMLLGAGKPADLVLAEGSDQHASFDTARDDGYPSSVMGATAVLRQALLDGDWYRTARAARSPSGRRIDRDAALEALARFGAQGRRAGGRMVFASKDVLDDLRAGRVAREFSLPLVLRGAGDEYRRLADVAALHVPVIAPVDFPAAPVVAETSEWNDVSTEQLRHWRYAPDNPRWLAGAGVDVSLTTDGLKDVKDFTARVRRCIDRGLSPDAALAMATTHPARLLGMSSRVGTLEPGRIANLVVSRGRPFARGTEIREVWVEGRRQVVSRDPEGPLGAWKAEIDSGARAWKGKLDISGKGGTFTMGDTPAAEGSAASASPAATPAAPRRTMGEEGAPAAASDNPKAIATAERGGTPAPKSPEGGAPTPAPQAATTASAASAPAGGAGATAVTAKVTGVEVDGDRVVMKLDGTPFGLGPDLRLAGASRGLVLDLASADGRVTLRGRRSFEPDAKPAPVVAPLSPPRHEGGPLADRSDVLLRGARIWTCGPHGVLDRGDILVSGGRIAAVGPGLSAPRGVPVIDVSGSEITPGLVDAHNHSAIVGGVNEGTRSCTAEVRIGDVVNSETIDVYRELAGGLTVANLLHGSANCMGGQSQVIKLRYGADPEAMKFRGATPAIKFALGENVKQSNWGEKFVTRFPQTRMGVETFMRDMFSQARDYAAEQRAGTSRGGVPPRRDLQLETLQEIIEGRRKVHCHSYRQDEILMLMRVAEEFGFRIGTFQHVLEGYKVADEIARHGAMASTFTDWWAYKFEVYDAIPYNAALMHDRGVVVSVNSDSTELARRMNLEAAKVVKWGGVPPADALDFVTINPARQLGIEDRVGSLEPGKDADLVVWSGNPLSPASRVETTYIDGLPWFDRKVDLARRDALKSEREAIIRLVGEARERDDAAGESWSPSYLQSAAVASCDVAGEDTP